MGDTEIASFLNKLEYMLLAEVDSLQDDEDQLWRLHGMLRRLMPFLIMEVWRNNQSKDLMEERKKAMDEVITFVHEAEDVADSYLTAIRRNGSSTDEAPDIGRKMKRMMERLKGIHERFLEFTDHRQSCTSEGTSSSKRLPPPPIIEEGDGMVVVLEDEEKKMTDLLLLKDDEDDDTPLRQCGVIPIVGRRGMGKTTLARRVYNHPAIVEHFPRRLWIYVSSDYKLEEVLRDIIKQIKHPTTTADEERKERMMSLKDLAIETYRLLKSASTRYLLVLDDVCTTQFWVDINIVFPNNNNKPGGGGNRIIFTTRYDEVASHARPCKPPLYLQRLSKEKSRELFKKRIARFLQHNSHSHSHHPWEAWVDACGGIPVTIVALAAEYQRLMLTDSYEEVEDKEKVKAVGFPPEIWKLIYNHLPHHLRACLAYLSLLQKSVGAGFLHLKGLIVAEGLVKPTASSSSLSLEDIAEEYVKELISRNLIEVSKRSFDDQILEIIIPDWEIPFLDHEIIFHGIASDSSDHDVMMSRCGKIKIRRVTNLDSCVLFEEDYYYNCGSDGSPSNLKVRFLAFSKETGLLERPLSPLDITSLDITSLRVLVNRQDPRESDFFSFTGSINLMIHLKYLHLSTTSSDIEYLSELLNLQFLHIEWRGLGHPSGRLELGKMRQLRHLFCQSVLVNRITGQKTSLLNNFQTLEDLEAEFCEEDVLCMIPNLVTLAVVGRISQKQLDILPLLLKRLQKLKLCGINMKKCQLGVCHQNITHLVLVNTCIDEGYVMPALRKLQNLRTLEFVYESIYFTKGSEGGVLDFTSSDEKDVVGFLPHLKVLALHGLFELKEWKMSVGVMPSLQKVSIDYCRNIERLPSEALKAIPTLQELVMVYSHGEQPLIDARLVEEHLGKDRLKLRFTDKLGNPLPP